jgi:hypothetical protein
MVMSMDEVLWVMLRESFDHGSIYSVQRGFGLNALKSGVIRRGCATCIGIASLRYGVWDVLLLIIPRPL